MAIVETKRDDKKAKRVAKELSKKKTTLLLTSMLPFPARFW